MVIASIHDAYRWEPWTRGSPEFRLYTSYSKQKEVYKAKYRLPDVFYRKWGWFGFVANDNIPPKAMKVLIDFPMPPSENDHDFADSRGISRHHRVEYRPNKWNVANKGDVLLISLIEEDGGNLDVKPLLKKVGEELFPEPSSFLEALIHLVTK